MIDLITGLPGNCKTLYTIAWVRDWAKKDNRAVFYSGIPLTPEGADQLGWQEINPEKWFEAPPNSIVVIDECQRIFRNRSLGATPGKHVTELETHRHLGIDLVFITQHPSLIDPAIRRLAGRHRHMIRIMGMERSTVHEWAAVRDNCDKPAGRKDSNKAVWAFDKSIYSLYKSAEVHTVKRTIPMRLWMLLALPFVLGAMGWFAYDRMKKIAPPAEQTVVKNDAHGMVAAPGQMGDGPKPFDPVADAMQYVAMNTERVKGLPHTAPKYDEITKPDAAPVPAACVYSQGRCQCYTQQATRMEVEHDVCRDIAHNGYFQDFDPNGGNRKESMAALDRVDGRLPLSGADTSHRPWVVTMGDGNGYGVLGQRVQR